MAVFAANDFAAAGVLDRLEDAGLRIPEDVSLVGYDKHLPRSAAPHLPDDRRPAPRGYLGTLAMVALLERMEGARSEPVRHLVAPSFLVRKTTGPAPPRRPARRG